MTVGVLGGTFNPIHLAHLRLAEEMHEALGLSRVWFVPAAVPPLKSEELAPTADRREMVRLAIAGNPRFELLDLELRRPGPSYTVDTLRELRRRVEGERLWFLCGSDTLAEVGRWREPHELFELASFAVGERPGTPSGDARSLLAPELALRFSESPDGLVHESGNVLRQVPITPLWISATELRRRVARGASIRYLVPDPVAEYIAKQRLYQEPA